MSQKVSIRFYKDSKVRGVWDDEQNKWFFSVLDIIGAINEQEDYQKNRNYWKYLKAKLKKEQSELVSATTQLKLLAPDGKRRLADAVDHEGVIKLALTDKIDDRELFMKGIDYSYYYEQQE
jgi:cell filamentation protein